MFSTLRALLPKRQKTRSSDKSDSIIKELYAVTAAVAERNKMKEIYPNFPIADAVAYTRINRKREYANVSMGDVESTP